MATVEKPVEQIVQPRTDDQRFVIYNLNWQGYDYLLAALGDRKSVRVTYDRGRVELMSPSREHEACERLITRMIYVLTEELDLPIISVGSMTCRREDLDRGLEPDSSFYLTNEAMFRDRNDLDLSVDPPPDLAIEVQLTNSIIDKVAIYAALGVPELWLYDMEDLRVLRLDVSRSYVEQEHSGYLPPRAMDGIRQFIAPHGVGNETAWAKKFRHWVRENLIS